MTRRTGSAAERAATLRLLTAAGHRARAAFIAGVLLGEQRTGARGVLTDAVAAPRQARRAVRRAAMLSGDLGGDRPLALTGTAAQLDAVASWSAVRCSPCSPHRRQRPAQRWKPRGGLRGIQARRARIQVHRVGDEVRIYSRTLAEVTHRLPRWRNGPRAAGARRDPRRRDPRPRRGRRSATVPGDHVAVRGRCGARHRAASRGSSTFCTSTGATCWTSRCPARIEVLERIAPEHRIPGRSRRTRRRRESVPRCARRWP